MTRQYKYFMFLITFSILVCTGCVPYHFTTRPGAIGTVIDAESKLPIAGAAITLKSSGFPEKHTEVSILTETDGQFLIKPLQNWSLYIVPMDPLPLKSVVTIRSNGYSEIQKEFRVNTMGPSMTNLGIIEMKSQK